MQLIHSLISAVALLFIFVEDMKYQQIRIVWFAVLILSIFSFRIFFDYNTAWLLSSGVNVALSVLLLLTSLLILKFVKPASLKTAASIGGAGDALMLFAFCIGCDSLAFFWLLLGSSVIALLLHFAVSGRIKTVRRNIPLAGYMAAVMVVVIFLSETDIVHLQKNEIWVKLLLIA